ncbi:MAG: hypothetical protein NDI73_07000 [Desulfuromonadales bacterium]|nr:hypothetical protein [Desulfuromonadales bacterium]
MLKMLLDYRILVPLVLFLGFAPFVPQPHLVEKIGMLADGTLHRPLDIFDLFWHSWPLALLAYRIFQDARTRLGSSQ